MNEYRKIATIVIRGLAYYLLVFVIIEWAIIAFGVLLANAGVCSRNSIAYEARLVASVVYLFAGLALLVKSATLGARIARDMDDDDDQEGAETEIEQNR